MLRSLMAAILATFLTAGAGAAATIGYDLTISRSGNQPTFRINNTSTVADILSFNLFIGNTAYNFDTVDRRRRVAAVGATVVTPADGQSGLRSDNILINFADFNVGEFFRFRTDVDIDNGNTRENYRSVLFPNGSLVVTFSGGESLTQLFDAPFAARTQSYSFSALAAVPLPAGLPLMIAALGAIGLLRRRKTA